MLDETGVVLQLAREAVDRVVTSVIRELDAMTEGCMSGDDSGPRTIWEEFCVQVQSQESIYWEGYEDLVRSAIEREVAKLAAHEMTAIWFQTNPGQDWLSEDTEDREAEVFIEDDVVEHVTQVAYSFADDFERDNIRAYLDRT